MKSYPYIGKYNGMIGLLVSKGYGICLSIQSSKYGEWVQESKLKNITADYLRNTKIRVESPEHSAMIQNLVFGAGGKWIDDFEDQAIQFLEKPFLLIDENLQLTHLTRFSYDCFIKSQRKEIKLPMPPSQSAEVKQPKDEWPRVGDDVSWGTENRFIGYVLSRFGDYAWIRSDDSEDDDAPITIDIDKLTKPPTPQERLRHLLISAMDNSNTAWTYADNIAKAIIAGEIEGLEYKKPQ